MTQAETGTPLLKPEHFKGLATQLTDQGLRFEARIGPDERMAEIFEIGDGEREVEDALAELEQIRPYTSVVANPCEPSAEALLKILCDAQDSLAPDESISIRHGLPSPYERRWSRNKRTDEDTEGQYLVLVAFDQNLPVGFIGLRVTLIHGSEEKQITINHSIELAYVHPVHRRKGFGIDLSLACSQLGQEVFEATYRAAPTGYTIVPAIYADFESEGGERITQQLAAGLDVKADMLRMYGKRRSITVKPTDVDVGY